ncbi:MAG TPA: MotA/TolQ/ExbB proton channel family protein [Acidobacteriota bacterium]|nr:MotA/TolQ/ExbB proton channel family protein [Acidobacteriota bacterium]
MQFGLVSMWLSMGWTARSVCIVLAIMSIYSLGVMIERWLTYSKAKKESLKFATQATQLLKQNKLKDVIAVSKNYKKSHLAKVVSAGLYEFTYETENPGTAAGFDVIEAAKRAIERASAMTAAELKRSLGGLATIGSTAPFVGLFGTVVGIIHAFQTMAISGGGGLGTVSAGIAEALVTTAFGLLVAIPAVWMYNYFTNRTERFNVEMNNSSNELIDYFIKQRGGSHARVS